MLLKPFDNEMIINREAINSFHKIKIYIKSIKKRKKEPKAL